MSGSEDASAPWAGVINGVMITLLGAAFPCLLLFQMVTHWSAIEIPREAQALKRDLSDGLSVAGLLAMSYAMMGAGLRLLTQSVRVLRQRRTRTG